METALIIPDIHAPFEHKPTIKIAMKLGAYLKPNYLVYLGDCFNANGISRFRDKRQTEEDGVYETAKEIVYFNKKIYQPLQEKCKRGKTKPLVYWCGGNHDEVRTRESIANTPERSYILDIRSIFSDAMICAYGDYHKIGKLIFTHGDYCNEFHAKKHLTTYLSSVVYGHTHAIQSYSLTGKADRNPHKALSMGCACEKTVPYIKTKNSSWQHALGVCYFDAKGNYNLYVVEIINNSCMFNGRTFTG